MGPLRRLLLATGALLSAAFSHAAEPVTLRLSVWDGDEALRTVRQVVADFERKNPGIRVKIENYADYALYHQKMVITYAANVAPDVAMMDAPNFQRLARRKALMPLNPLFEKTPGFDIKAFYPQIVAAHSWQGQCYVLPRDIAPMGLIYYNKKAFADAGLGDPKEYDDKWTFTTEPRPELGHLDFLTVCSKLMRKDAKGKTTRWAYSSGWPELIAQSAGLAMGGTIVDNPEDPTKITTTDPRWMAGYQFAYDLIKKWGYMPSNTDTSAVLMQNTQQLFASKKIAMYQNGIWEVPNVRKTLKPGSKEFFEWDICLAPRFGGDRGGAPDRALSGGSGYGIFSSTQHPEEAWKLLQHLSGEPGMTAMARAGIAQPAIAELATRPGIWVPGPETPIEQMYPANRLATHEAVSNTYWPMTWEGAKTVNDRLAKGLELVWNGQKPPGPIMREDAKLAQDRLDVLRRQERLPMFNWTIGTIVGLSLVAGLAAWIFLPERRRGRLTRQQKAEATAAYKFLSPWFIGLIAFTLGPMVLSLLMAFADWDIISPAKFRGMGNFREALTEDPTFYPSLWATLKYTAFSVPMGIVGSLSLALLLNQKVRGVAIYRSLYYIPSIASFVAASLIWRRLFNKESGLFNAVIYGSDGQSAVGDALSNLAQTPGQMVDWFGNEVLALPALIIMSLWGVGGGMVIFLAGLQGIPQHYYEAATLDGAGTIGKFRNVTLPLLTPTIFFTLITGFIGSLQVFTQALIITQGGPNDKTRFFVYYLYQNAFESVRMGYAAALGWILFAIVLVFTVIQVKGSKWVYYEAEAK